MPGLPVPPAPLTHSAFIAPPLRAPLRAGTWWKAPPPTPQTGLGGFAKVLQRRGSNQFINVFCYIKMHKCTHVYIYNVQAHMQNIDLQNTYKIDMYVKPREN